MSVFKERADQTAWPSALGQNDLARYLEGYLNMPSNSQGRIDNVAISAGTLSAKAIGEGKD